MNETTPLEAETDPVASKIAQASAIAQNHTILCHDAGIQLPQAAVFTQGTLAINRVGTKDDNHLRSPGLFDNAVIPVPDVANE